MGFNHYRGKARLIVKCMIEGTPFAEGFDGGMHDDRQGHVYRDAVIVEGPYSTWCYHGNPIAQYNRETKEWKASTCGWDTLTTRARLNAIPGMRIWRHKGKSYGENVWGMKKAQLAEAKEWEDDNTMVLPHPTYCRYDAWRGHSVPLTVVCGASNTGGWSDSPCQPEDEIKAFQTHLQKHGIKSTVCWTATSNVFCTKTWVQVHPKWLGKARELWKAYDAEVYTKLLHSA